MCMTYQIYYISDQYFRYDSSTHVVIDVMREVALPRFTARISTNELLNLKEICERKPTLCTGDKIEELYQYFQDNLFHLTPSVKEIVSDCKLKAVVSNAMAKCESQNLAKGVMMLESVYYSLQFENRTVSMNAEKFRHGLSRLYSLKLNLTKYINVSDVSVTLRPPNMDINALDLVHYHHIVINRKEDPSNNSFFFNFNYLQIERLPYPYETNCLDYTTVGLQSQTHCLANCYEFILKRDVNDSTYELMQTNKHPPIPLNIMVGVFNYTDDTKQGVLDQHCRKSCFQDDCKSQIFTIILKHVGHERRNKWALGLYLAVPMEPTISLQYRPSMSTTDYITYVFSCISFWLGWSPLVCLQDFYKSRRGNRRPSVANQPSNSNRVSNQRRIDTWVTQSQVIAIVNINIAAALFNFEQRLNQFMARITTD